MMGPMGARTLDEVSAPLAPARTAIIYNLPEAEGEIKKLDWPSPYARVYF